MTYTIPRYPVHLIDFVSAANGRRVTIRPMLPQDFKLQREFFRSLSANARYSRFLTSFNELPDGVAERLGKFDYSRHLALLAEVFEGDSETMVGEARYVIDEHDPATCEFAIAVANDWQGCGIGRALLAKLEREAAASGIRRMRADTLYDNKAMGGLAARSGYAVRANSDDARLVKLEKQLSAWTANVQPLAACRRSDRAREASAMANKWNVATAGTRRAQRAAMSPAEFIALVAGWSGGVVLLLFISALARYLT